MKSLWEYGLPLFGLSLREDGKVQLGGSHIKKLSFLNCMETVKWICSLVNSQKYPQCLSKRSTASVLFILIYFSFKSFFFLFLNKPKWNILNYHM